jgi:hypothetical protein
MEEILRVKFNDCRDLDNGELKRERRKKRVMHQYTENNGG